MLGSVYHIVPLIFALFSGNNAEVCRTKGCMEASNLLQNMMDVSVDPCDDFYKYTCGNMTKYTVIPEDKSSWGPSAELEMLILDRLKQQLESPPPEGESPLFQKARDFYASCIDEDTIEKKGLDEAKEHLAELGGWPVLQEAWNEETFSWTETTGKLSDMGHSIDALVKFYVSRSDTDSTKYILHLHQPSLGVPREYLIQGLASKVVRVYYNVLVDNAKEFGASYASAKNDMLEALNLEIELAKISLPREELRDYFAQSHHMIVSQLQEKYPFISWMPFIQSLLADSAKITNEEIILVKVPTYLYKLQEVLNKTPKRVLANYLMGRAIFEMGRAQNKRMRDIIQPLYTAVDGTTTELPRWQFCLKSMMSQLDALVGALYVRKYFSPQDKEKVTEIANLLRKHFIGVINDVNWMDHQTKNWAMEKAGKIINFIAYPDEFLNDSVLEHFYDKLEITKSEFTKNVFSIRKWQRHRFASKLHTTAPRITWEENTYVTEVNAYYNPSINGLLLIAGILQGIYYSADRPVYLNLATLSTVIGHELTHSVDDMGKQFDELGNLINWWGKTTDEEYRKKADEIVHEYSTYEVSEVGMKLNGWNVQGEVIADHGGIKVAYRALEELLQNQSGDVASLEGLDLSVRKMFWLSAASTWCTKTRVERLKSLITTGYHPPAEFRVNGPFRHSPMFAKDWGCRDHSYMNPEHRFNVW